MKNILTTALTGPDNVTFDVGRILWAFAMLALIGHETFAICHGQPFDPISFATACGGLLAAGAAALRLKAPAERGDDHDNH